MATTATHDENEAGALRGASCWLISDGRAGNISQLRGVAAALRAHAREIEVAPGRIWKLLAPWGPVEPSERFGQAASRFAPPWPRIAIATGRASIPYIRALKKHAGDATFTLVLQDPRSGPATADMIWVPAHDKLRAPNVITTLTSPHVYSPDRLEALRAGLPADIAALPSPRFLVALGGRNKVYRYEDGDHRRLAGGLQCLADLGASFMITASRRSHDELLRLADEATKNSPRIVWNGEGDNPYPYFLAACDSALVTADSVNMCGEAAVTAKPVFVFHPTGGSDKFNRFHTGLVNHGAVRPLPERLDALPDWTYRPLFSAARIAAQVERRYADFRARHGLGGNA